VVARYTRILSRPLSFLILFVLFLRLPFLNMPVQGDDVYYLAQAEHAQIEPLHPTNVRYVFNGEEVDLRGHPHPPFNGWFLGLLLALSKDVHVGFFHLAYLGFSFLAAASVWSIARRFTEHPLWASLLFLVTPTFVVNGTSFETDLPFVSFWLAAVALFLEGSQEKRPRRLLLSALAMMLAALTAYQAVVLVPILWWYLWLRDRGNRMAWVLTLAPVLTVVLYQAWERATTGALPAAVLTGYFQTYGFQAIANKIRNAVGLTVHLLWIVFPPLLWFYLRHRKKHREPFLEGWIVLFYIAALILFFAGSARYLLPLAAPVAILATRPGRWLPISFAVYLVLSLCLAFSNFAHWEAYKRFAREVAGRTQGRIWVNAEWGLRFYLEAEGALPVKRNQVIHPGETLVTSKLAYPVPVNTGGTRLTPIATQVVRPILPFQLIGLTARSGYSTSSKGFLPFDVSWAPIDELEAALLSQVEPELSRLTMSAPQAKEQLASGFYELEQDAWRWMARQGVALLKPPPMPSKAFVEFAIPDPSPVRQVRLKIGDQVVGEARYNGSGHYTLESKEPVSGGSLVVEVDQTFTPPGDNRELGIIVTGLGFR
jgi:4-amino-4-deoxy-L-arabinose transferase-like glycosyltransferase